MSDNVAEYTGLTRLQTPVPKILAAAAGAKLQDVVVIGWRENGEMYFASSQADGANVNWLLDMAKQALLGCGCND